MGSSAWPGELSNCDPGHSADLGGSCLFFRPKADPPTEVAAEERGPAKVGIPPVLEEKAPLSEEDEDQTRHRVNT